MREQDEFATIPPKRIRVRRPRLCRTRLTLPSHDGKAHVVFTCTRRHQPDLISDNHEEIGRVRLPNGNVFDYYVVWSPEPVDEVWRGSRASQELDTE